MNVAVAGVPKTIDNDVDIIDRSFGFLTSVEVCTFAAGVTHPLIGEWASLFGNKEEEQAVV